jgi:hypothetical protein
LNRYEPYEYLIVIFPQRFAAAASGAGAASVMSSASPAATIALVNYPSYHGWRGAPA